MKMARERDVRDEHDCIKPHPAYKREVEALLSAFNQLDEDEQRMIIYGASIKLAQQKRREWASVGDEVREARVLGREG